jgi:hypothetical protein
MRARLGFEGAGRACHGHYYKRCNERMAKSAMFVDKVKLEGHGCTWEWGRLLIVIAGLRADSYDPTFPWFISPRLVWRARSGLVANAKCDFRLGSECL